MYVTFKESSKMTLYMTFISFLITLHNKILILLGKYFVPYDTLQRKLSKSDDYMSLFLMNDTLHGKIRFHRRKKKNMNICIQKLFIVNDRNTNAVISRFTVGDIFVY